MCTNRRLTVSRHISGGWCLPSQRGLHAEDGLPLTRQTHSRHNADPTSTLSEGKEDTPAVTDRVLDTFQKHNFVRMWSVKVGMTMGACIPLAP